SPNSVASTAARSPPWSVSPLSTAIFEEFRQVRREDAQSKEGEASPSGSKIACPSGLAEVRKLEAELLVRRAGDDRQTPGQPPRSAGVRRSPVALGLADSTSSTSSAVVKRTRWR